MLGKAVQKLTVAGTSRFLFPAYTGRVTSCRAASHAKRFYKDVSVAGTSGCYEVNLDHRKLKTPMGNVLQVPSYPLALAVAEEWRAVQDVIIPAFMHLTGLSYTVVDNPNRVSKWDMAESVLEFLPTDTVLFADENSEKFSAVQEEQWWPVLRWFNDRYKLNIEPSTGINPAEVSDAALGVLRRHILSHNHWAVAGMLYGTDAIKSVILTLAAVERRISARDAVRLSRLEVDFQSEHWGRVEWGHDMDQRDLEARFAASLFFIHLNMGDQHRVKKKDQAHNYTT
ncbi:ATP synthase mitochondrial F1 complex assembly factor 2-like isoform X2 [Hyalella azteca]|uniref:ATP synthase mitochondrial F1 complex assembly factor 2-like isoform X2 n=1 Tax=Hyalella azteca TaxID=294128 RepID=A0A8B7PN67_HYAAZ|nr:ATP synthase mitochondrial F1 complex assembly factor 2-like isoform X2 [Hyalella azteca]